jgi:hypothetical protein
MQSGLVIAINNNVIFSDRVTDSDNVKKKNSTNFAEIQESIGAHFCNTLQLSLLQEGKCRLDVPSNSVPV